MVGVIWSGDPRSWFGYQGEFCCDVEPTTGRAGRGAVFV